MGEHDFTPGPWLISSISKTTVENRSGRGICSTGGYQQNFDTERVYRENLANARLIAAVPDLLEALFECEEYFDSRADADCDQDGFVPNKEMRLLSVVREAIRKAEGQK